MFNDKLDDGVTVKVLYELDDEGVDDICTQVLKLSEETCRVPEHVVFEAFVVMVVVSIASLKVTVREVFGAIDVAASAGDDEENVGAVVSGVLEVVKPDECV